MAENNKTRALSNGHLCGIDPAKTGLQEVHKQWGQWEYITVQCDALLAQGVLDAALANTKNVVPIVVNEAGPSLPLPRQGGSKRGRATWD